MPAFPFPTNWEQDTAYYLPDLVWNTQGIGQSKLLKHFPMSYTDAGEVHYDQLQNMGGLMPLRSLDGPPDVIDLPGLTVSKIQPGFYGLEARLTETQMTVAREGNTINEPLDTGDYLGLIALNSSVMIRNRIYQTMGTFAVTGSFTNTSADGTRIHRYVVPNYQTFRPNGVTGQTGPGWSANPALATPISDLVYWQSNFLFPGTSADFGEESELMCSPQTVNTIWNTSQVQKYFVSNLGANYKRGKVYAPKLNGENSINELMTGSGLPAISVCHDGYYATLAGAIAQDPTQWTYALPTNTLFWAGKRPEGQQAGALKLTKHAGIGAYQADRFPEVDVKDKGMAELAKGIYVVAEYQKLMPNMYRFQAGMNMAPMAPYPRAFAGIATG